MQRSGQYIEGRVVEQKPDGTETVVSEGSVNYRIWAIQVRDSSLYTLPRPADILYPTHVAAILYTSMHTTHLGGGADDRVVPHHDCRAAHGALYHAVVQD